MINYEIFLCRILCNLNAFFSSTHQPINPSTHQPINPSTHQPINPSTHQPINYSTSLPIYRFTSQTKPQTEKRTIAAASFYPFEEFIMRIEKFRGHFPNDKHK